jgi:hypothetical protein
MKISKFWQLTIKGFFRAPQWEVAYLQPICLPLFWPSGKRIPHKGLSH